MSVQTVKVTINGQNYNLTYNGTSGKWEATITSPSTTSYNVNGGHYYPVTLVATDNAGNAVTKNDTDGTLGSSLQLKVKETTVPTISITSPTGGSFVTNAKPTISFQLRDSDSGINISTLSLKIDSGSIIGNIATGMTCASVTGGYDCTYAVQTALTDGSHTITITIADNDGNTSSTTSSTFTVDTIPPALSVSIPVDNLVTNNSSLSVSGTTSDADGVTITIKLNGADQGAVTVTSGNFSKVLTLAEGINTIIVTATDNAGLTTTVTRTVTLDTVAPVVSVVTLTPNPVNTGNTFTISVTVSDTY